MNAPAVLACPAWCRADHTRDGADRTHTLQVGPFSGPGHIVLHYLQADAGGRRGQAHPRMVYLDGEQRTVVDVDLTDAYDWAGVIAGLDIRSLAEFPLELRRMAELLEGDTGFREFATSALKITNPRPGVKIYLVGAEAEVAEAALRVRDAFTIRGVGGLYPLDDQPGEVCVRVEVDL